ncbi:MAG: 4Fe-4S binding protein [Prevotellaceae bacterium]|jgi:polyferredoxin|nr:4Fe-4S binding protein [Prevotellaceae bacterium]
MDKVYFLIIFLVVGVIFGKIFCGKVCPLGYLQDWLYRIPFPKKIRKFRGEKWLLYLKYVSLAAMIVSAIWSAESVAEEDSSGFSISKIVIYAAVCLAFIIFYRPFCKYFCSYGAMLSLFNLFSPYRYRIDKNKCINCNKCAKVCRMNVAIYKAPNHTECIRCGRCKKACPAKAIYAGLKKTSEL